MSNVFPKVVLLKPVDELNVMVTTYKCATGNFLTIDLFTLTVAHCL